MTTNVRPPQTMSFKARSLLAFVLEPTPTCLRMAGRGRRLASPFAAFFARSGSSSKWLGSRSIPRNFEIS